MAIGEEIFIGNEALGTISLDLGRGRWVGTVLGQRHAVGVRSLGPVVVVDPIDSIGGAVRHGGRGTGF